MGGGEKEVSLQHMPVRVCLDMFAARHKEICERIEPI